MRYEVNNRIQWEFCTIFHKLQPTEKGVVPSHAIADNMEHSRD